MKGELDETSLEHPIKTKGPHGLGDPDDTSLRKVEKEVLIPKIIRDRSREEKCIAEVAAFTKCGKESGLMMWLNCRQENKNLKSCLANWWNNEDFREECKQKYLRDRTEYRRTGLTMKQRKAEENKQSHA
ncbi:COX assembly mitochondrial protein homolog [Macrosteles quadrilineatus]|uniref:COX assembly mitochondrial protein homolog n=1 Tax=Macrosteles quadrilineatus TaxID=74068 RepID=UPI0023E33FBC|nr:COX assembly mitochondrial protein homolog [Macrosteles quadrilineatus]